MSSTSETEKRRTQLDVWMAKRGITRKQLAIELGVSEASVYGWLSNTNIPDKRWEDLKAFFSEEEEEKPILEFRAVSFVASKVDEENIRKVADMCGMSVDEFVRETILQKVRERLQ